MRFLIILLALITPAQAQPNWGYYENARYGYALDIPPGFDGQGESANGDGQVFLLDGRVARLTVWGGVFATAPDFEAEANARIAGDTEDGWGLAAHATSPTWATWSATKPGRVMHQHMITLCDGQSYAALRFDYAQVDRRKLDALIEPLVASFNAPC